MEGGYPPKSFAMQRMQQRPCLTLRPAQCCLSRSGISLSLSLVEGGTGIQNGSIGFRNYDHRGTLQHVRRLLPLNINNPGMRHDLLRVLEIERIRMAPRFRYIVRRESQPGNGLALCAEILPGNFFGIEPAPNRSRCFSRIRCHFLSLNQGGYLLARRIEGKSNILNPPPSRKKSTPS